MGRRSVRAAQFLQVVSWSERFVPLFPVMVLMAKEASVLSLTDLGRLAIVALLAGLDAGNQNVRRLLAGKRASVAGLAVDADVSVMTEDRVGQPYRFDV